MRWFFTFHMSRFTSAFWGKLFLFRSISKGGEAWEDESGVSTCCDQPKNLLTNGSMENIGIAMKEKVEEIAYG
jgi:hypothetical protein